MGRLKCSAAQVTHVFTVRFTRLPWTRNSFRCGEPPAGKRFQAATFTEIGDDHECAGASTAAGTLLPMRSVSGHGIEIAGVFSNTLDFRVSPAQWARWATAESALPNTEAGCLDLCLLDPARTSGCLPL